MLFSINTLSQCKINATDGELGQVHSFLFDDQNWAIRYLVIDTAHWLPGRKVLIAPSALGKPEASMEAFPVELSKEQIKNSPDINTQKPISRQKEVELHQYYGWVPYWESAVNPVIAPYAAVVPPMSNVPKEKQVDSETKMAEQAENSHLRSSKEVTGYHIHAEDGEIGHVEDFLLEDTNWHIRYMIIDTRNWLPGKKVIITPDCIKEISWEKAEVAIDVLQEKVKNSPKFDYNSPVNREYETKLFNYYGWQPYWI